VVERGLPRRADVLVDGAERVRVLGSVHPGVRHGRVHTHADANRRRLDELVLAHVHAAPREPAMLDRGARSSVRRPGGAVRAGCPPQHVHVDQLRRFLPEHQPVHHGERAGRLLAHGVHRRMPDDVLTRAARGRLRAAAAAPAAASSAAPAAAAAFSAVGQLPAGRRILGAAVRPAWKRQHQAHGTATGGDRRVGGCACGAVRLG
jgi:hypothetical protein